MGEDPEETEPLGTKQEPLIGVRSALCRINPAFRRSVVLDKISGVSGNFRGYVFQSLVNVFSFNAHNLLLQINVRLKYESLTGNHTVTDKKYLNCMS
jgi:hypothetical protein